MLYVSYRHKNDPTRELVMHDGASFPGHLKPRDWYLHATHTTATGRTEADIATRGYCDRNAGVPFGRKVAAKHNPGIDRRLAT